MEPFKNIFNPKSVKQFSKSIKAIAGKDFNKVKFDKLAASNLENLEMKDRVRLLAATLQETMAGNYSDRIDIFIHCLADTSEESTTGISGFMTWPLLHYVEEYGLDDFATSFRAMYEMTQRFSAEFAIRAFLLKDDKEVFKILHKWTKDPNKHIRRLCSEGTRPNLPWGMRVPVLRENLERNISLLEGLKDDPEDYVQRSVANHLNDISRLDEKLMIKIAKNWTKGDPNQTRQWIVRHASRTLLKKGIPQALKLHGYNPKARIKISKFKIDKKAIKEGDELNLSITLKNTSSKREKVLLDYIIYFRKKNGAHSAKPFRLRDIEISANQTLLIEKNIPFKKVTTRKHYPGPHFLSLQLNGNESSKISFRLV